MTQSQLDAIAQIVAKFKVDGRCSVIISGSPGVGKTSMLSLLKEQLALVQCPHANPIRSYSLRETRELLNVLKAGPASPCEGHAPTRVVEIDEFGASERPAVIEVITHAAHLTNIIVIALTNLPPDKIEHRELFDLCIKIEKNTAPLQYRQPTSTAAKTQ